MKFAWIMAVGLGITLLAGNAGAEEETLKTQKDKISYIIGRDIGMNLKKQTVDVDLDLFIKGMRDGMAGNKSPISDEEMKKTMISFKQEMQRKQAEEAKKAGEKNKKEGEEFLAANKKKEGVKTLQSGLQYSVITEGAGKSPKASDMVTVNYRGTLIDGTEFDSSYKRGQPAIFQVNAVIPGWTEALQLMKEGSKWQLFIPANLAYGEKGAGNVITPNSTLIFEVELISVQQETKEAPAGK